ncbi:hypothetical protein N7456_013424 [Penicillium angulare]|uniref:Uncharacterized protein n=1 Tax=Penicillium angulare TaxID=116970 RepID=A0A9W9EG62_9EURO|nr:hypothetical protein N7456_013424 [Penicillium angulare]
MFNAMGAGGANAMPMPDIKTPSEVRRESVSRADEIFFNYEALHDIISRHEGTIRKRWSKKTRSQRLKILLSAWPNMPSTHRPDFDAFKKGSDSANAKGTKYRDSFMWPYINQEDLLTTKALPLLLNARGRHPPSHFAGADLQAMHFGMVTKALLPIFLNGHIMILNGIEKNDRAYGRLMAWDEHPDAFEWMTSQKQFLPGEGLMILESQERLLKGLVKCCHELLRDIPESSLTSDEFPVLPEPQLKRESEIHGFESLNIMATEAPYRLPAKLNLQCIQSLLSAKASAAQDHLWALREDPEYFASVVLESRVIASVVSEAYFPAEVFSELSLQAENLISLQNKYAADIFPSKDLPKEYSDALLRFRLYLDQAVKGPLGILKTACVASPPLRRLFAREPPLDPDSTRIVVVSKGGLKRTKVEHELLYLLSTLWDDGQNLFLASLPVVTDELERLIQSEKSAHELISPYIIGIIGDLSILSQCLNQLALYQPWARTLDNTRWKEEHNLKADYVKRTEPWGRIIGAIGDMSSFSKAASLGVPSSGKFTYPFEKRRTRENVKALRKAENNLDMFWAAIDRIMIAKAGDLSGTAVHTLLSLPRTLQRTPEWIETEKPSSVNLTKGKENGTDINAFYKPFSQIYFDVPTKQTDITQVKTKVKTRGKAQQQPAPVAEAQALEQPNPADSQPTFCVDARAHKVFRTIFFNPSTTSTPGEVPWNEFLHAMTSVGFAAIKLHGSTWQFEPTKLDVERNIQFHEPHPKGKLAFRVARNYGRRLNRAYG